MQITVNGEPKELEAIGKNGVEWTRDLLGNYNALHYDAEIGEYTMAQDEFEWWENVVIGLNEVQEMEDELDAEQRSRYNDQDFGGADFEDEVNDRWVWLHQELEKQERGDRNERN